MPEEVTFFSDEEWRHFVGVAERELGRRGLQFERYGLLVRVEQPKPWVLGLLNLAQMCQREPRNRWPQVARGFYDGLFEPGPPDERRKDFEWARPLLKVRLQPDDYPAGTEAEIVARPFAESVIAVLALDLPKSVVTVRAEDAAAWGRPDGDLFDLAYANTRAEPIGLQRLEPTEGVDLLAVVGDSFFTTTCVAWLDEAVGPLPVQGALVGLPHRHMVLVHPIKDLSAVKAVNSMIPMIRGLYQEGPGSLSRHLYWWRGGSLTWLSSRTDQASVEFLPPAEFVDLLNRLGL